MTDGEITDLINHLADRVGRVICDTIDLIDEPHRQTEVLITVADIILNSIAAALVTAYEEDTGKTVSHKDMVSILLKEVLPSAKKANG